MSSAADKIIPWHGQQSWWKNSESSGYRGRVIMARSKDAVPRSTRGYESDIDVEVDGMLRRTRTKVVVMLV